MKRLIALAMITLAQPSFAQDAVRYLGAFDRVGSDVSVTPLGDNRLEFCWTNASRQSACNTFVYSFDAGIARFASFSDGQFAFDLVTNVLTQTRPDGVVKTADMTPVAR